MKRFGLLFLLVVSSAENSSAQTNKMETAPLTVIRAGTLIDGQSETPRKNQLIFVRGHRIEKVTDASATIPPASATTIDLSSATVLPGLIDSHTHLFLWGEDPAKGGYDANILKAGLALRAARATYAARRALEQGFTTLRDVETEGAGYGDIGIKQAIEEGTIPGPRIFGATRGISTTGGYNLEGYAPELTMPKGVQIVDGPVEARKATREQLEHGADWIKVYMTHRSWVDKQGHLVSQPTLTVEELRAIVDEAHKPTAGERKWRVTRTTAKASSAASTAVAIPSNMDSISATRRSRRWPDKARGIAPLSASITPIGPRKILLRDSGIARAQICTKLPSAKR